MSTLGRSDACHDEKPLPRVLTSPGHSFSYEWPAQHSSLMGFGLTDRKNTGKAITYVKNSSSSTFSLLTNASLQSPVLYEPPALDDKEISVSSLDHVPAPTEYSQLLSAHVIFLDASVNRTTLHEGPYLFGDGSDSDVE